MDLRQREHIETVVKVTTRGLARSDEAADEAIIRNSWRRCVHQHGLDPSRMQKAQILPASRLREHQQRLDDFVRIARYGLQALYAQVTGMGYVVLLTDAQGVTVDYLGDASADEQLRRAGLYPGAKWSENEAGTNAVGTALATGKVLTVHQTDHFDTTHIPLTCTAAPLFDTRGNLNAVLDISALTSPSNRSSQALALQMVNIHASLIENAYFLRAHRRDWILRLNTAAEFLDVTPEYLIALDADGRITGFNRRARRLLDAARNEASAPCALPGLLFEEVFDARLSSLGRFVHSASGEYHRIALARGGGRLYLRATPPMQPRPAQSGASPDLVTLPAPLAALCGGDAALTQQLERAARLIDSPVNLVIHGETGSGKEYFAKALHAASARRTQPFVAVNCAAIPEALIESELFGYMPNSFSGAGARGKRGLIQEADGGTLFLDEIGDMPRELQSRLLRVLAEGEVLPIGAARPVPVRLRVICATHRDLESLVAQGRFREDLYYRLAGARFVLVPLRERTDIDWLIDKLLAGGHIAAIPLSAQARACLHRHRWPGNLRELRNVLAYARAVCTGTCIEASDLPDELGATTFAPSDKEKSVPPAAKPAAPSSENVQLLDRLRAGHWNLSAVARQMGVSRMTLYRRMARLGIQSPNHRDIAAG